ncbi:hypothetical protein OL548_25235 [Lysinibacillus sp. MHQ-1]|nr:hypothetical protein OL548_25235 [Lysinibacillus sp. MHQ-1]
MTIGRYIEHLDFFSIYQWLTGTFIRVSFLLYIVVDLLKMTGDPKRIWQMIAPPFFIICLPLIMLNESLFFKGKGTLYFKCYFYFFYWHYLFFFIVVAYLSDKSPKKGEN